MQPDINMSNPSALPARAMELQKFILARYSQYASRPVDFEKHKWDFQEESSLTLLRSAAKSAGFTGEDFRARNEMVAERRLQLSPIRHLHGGLVATYVTSGNYYNTPARRFYNPSQRLLPQPLTLSMADIIAKFRRESEEASYAWGKVLDGAVNAMKLQQKFSSGLSIILLRNYLAENKKPGKSWRGVYASPEFINALNYYAENKIFVKSDQFLSTTLYWRVALNFASGHYDSVSSSEVDKKVIFIVEGHSGAAISAWLDEGEVLYPPETCFRITKGGLTERLGYPGCLVFKLKEVPTPSQPDKVAFLSDTGKMQRLAANYTL